jgi:hypothetical protein
MNIKKIIRSFAFVVWLYSLMAWAFICVKMTVSIVDMNASIMIIDGIDLTILRVAVIAFTISAISLWIFLFLRDDQIKLPTWISKNNRMG